MFRVGLSELGDVLGTCRGRCTRKTHKKECQSFPTQPKTHKTLQPREHQHPQTLKPSNPKTPNPKTLKPKTPNPKTPNPPKPKTPKPYNPKILKPEKTQSPKAPKPQNPKTPKPQNPQNPKTRKNQSPNLLPTSCQAVAQLRVDVDELQLLNRKARARATRPSVTPQAFCLLGVALNPKPETLNPKP